MVESQTALELAYGINMLRYKKRLWPHKNCEWYSDIRLRFKINQKLKINTQISSLSWGWSGEQGGRPTCRNAGALLWTEAGHGTAAGRSSSSTLDVQLPVVVAVISYPRPIHGLNPCGGRSTCGRVQSVVVGVDRVRESGGQHHRAAAVQQQRLLAARPAGQDAVYAEHPCGHHTGALQLGKSEKWKQIAKMWKCPARKLSAVRGKSSLKTRHGDSGGVLFSLLARLREIVSRMRTADFNGTSWEQGWLYTLLTSQRSRAALGSAAAARVGSGHRSVYWELIQLR